MARFSFDGNPVLTDTEFNNMISTDKGLREARYCGGYCDKHGRQKGHYVNWPSYMDVHDITDDQRAIALQRFEERREEIRREYAVPGTLFIVTMGGDYEPTTEGGIGNYRVRILFRDRKGDVRGCEFRGHWRSAATPDESTGFTFDRWNISERERQEKAYSGRMAELEQKYGKGKFIPFEERPEWPMSYAERGDVTNLPFTGKGITRWLARVYKVRFDRVHIDRYFFNCDEIISEPITKEGTR